MPFRGLPHAVILDDVQLQCHTCVMRRERVFQAAARLHVSSRRLLVYLDSQDLAHSTASSSLSSEAAVLLQRVTTAEVLTESSRHYRYRPAPRKTFWSWEHDDWGWDDRSWRNWTGPDELTTSDAAAAYAVTPGTIRQWVRRGHLSPLRREGRTSVFAARDVHDAAMATGQRNIQPGGPLGRDRHHVRPAGRFLTADAMHRVVTAEEAGSLLSLSASTIRSWRHRGLLTPIRHESRTPLYLMADVVSTARRAPYHPPRRRARPLL